MFIFNLEKEPESLIHRMHTKLCKNALFLVHLTEAIACRSRIPKDLLASLIDA